MSSSAVGHLAGVLHVLVAVLSVLPLAVVSRVLSWKLAREWLYHGLIAASSRLGLCWCRVETGCFLSEGSHGLLVLLLEQRRGWNWCSSKWGWSAGWAGNSFVSHVLGGGYLLCGRYGVVQGRVGEQRSVAAEQGHFAPGIGRCVRRVLGGLDGA